MHIALPLLHTLRPIVERIKSVASVLTISANMAGELRIKADNDVVKIETFFENLENPSLGKLCSRY